MSFKFEAERKVLRIHYSTTGWGSWKRKENVPMDESAGQESEVDEQHSLPKDASAFKDMEII